MKTLKKIYDGIVEVEGWIAVVALVAAIVLNAYEILQRNLWGNSFIWIQENLRNEVSLPLNQQRL